MSVSVLPNFSKKTPWTSFILVSDFSVNWLQCSLISLVFNDFSEIGLCVPFGLNLRDFGEQGKLFEEYRFWPE